MRINGFRSISILVALVIAAGYSVAQNATPPPPPADAPASSLQQPAPESNLRAVRLSNVYGSVKVSSDGQVDFQQAQLNMPLLEGMKIATADDGRAEIQFEDGSVARITPNSSLTLTELGREEDGTTITSIEADSGLTYYELNERSGEYSVTFGADKITPVDSAIFRLDLDSAPAELAVMYGSVHAGNDSGLDVEAHTEQTLQFNPNNPNEYQLLESVAANSWDQWNSDRDEAMAQVASNGNNDDDSGSAYGDLDAYGNWYDVPGYGMGWSPYGVGDNWDPYGVGSWGYYNNIGYTWISPYPWGWLPYHCGSWSWFGGFGWLWFPGDCGWGATGASYGWYPYGTIWSAPPDYVCPQRPAAIRQRNLPIRNPKHGPVPALPLIAVNRAPQFATLPQRSVGPVRVLQLNGLKISPVQNGNRGDGFAASGGRTTYPGSFVRRAYGPVYRPGNPQPGNHSGAGNMPAPRDGSGVRMRVPPPQPVQHPAPIYHAPATPRYHEPAPTYHAPPPPVFHAPEASPKHGK